MRWCLSLSLQIALRFYVYLSFALLLQLAWGDLKNKLNSKSVPDLFRSIRAIVVHTVPGVSGVRTTIGVPGATGVAGFLSFFFFYVKTLTHAKQHKHHDNPTQHSVSISISIPLFYPFSLSWVWMLLPQRC